jgi:hypothetical protein
VKLTDQEKAILDGKEGAARQAALDLLVRYGIAMDADRMLDVTSVACSIVNYYPQYLIDGIDPDNFDSAYAVLNMGVSPCQTAGMHVPCASANANTLATAASLDYYKYLGAPKELIESVEKLYEFSRSHKFHDTRTCAPYLVGSLPMKGEHVAWGESSAVIFVNSVMGARTNCEGVQSSGAAAIVGKIPNAGLHLDENRFGTHLIHVEKVPKTPVEWDLMGYYCGKVVGEGAPVFIGDFGVVTLDLHKNLGAALSTTGGVDLYHIVGFTPEAPTLKAAFGDRKPIEEFAYGLAEENHAKEVLDSGKGNAVDLVLLGCPFYSINQIRKVADLLEGKKLHPGTRMIITTAWMTKALAKESGYAKTIEDAGGYITDGTCPPMVSMWPDGLTCLATDSGKMAHYSGANRNDLEIHLGDVEQCVRAALTGIWA